MHIRTESPTDRDNIHRLIKAAFLNAPHTDHTEHFIVDALRRANALSVSLVAEQAGQIVGHVALSAVTITDGAQGWYGLGPIAVQPEEQGKGIGRQLVQTALTELRARSARGCVLLGNPAYYHRFGFAPRPGLILPGVPAEYFQATLIQGSGYPQGEVEYHPAFGAKD